MGIGKSAQRPEEGREKSTVETWVPLEEWVSLGDLFLRGELKKKPF